MRIDQSYSAEEQPSLSHSYFLLVVIEASKYCPYVCPFLHSSVRLSDIRTLFYIILRHRDVFRFIFTSFVMYFRSFLRHPFHCVAPIVNFNFNPKLTRSFISFLFQIWLNHLLGGQTLIKFFRCFGTDQYNALALPFQSTFVDFISKSD